VERVALKGEKDRQLSPSSRYPDVLPVRPKGHKAAVSLLCGKSTSGHVREFFSLYRKPPWRFSRNPDMKIVGKAADFCGTKEKREENETMISM